MPLFNRPDLAPATDKSVEVAVGLLVPPLLLGILVARALSDGLSQAGLASEQIFAGQRLPNLKIPHPQPGASVDD